MAKITALQHEEVLKVLENSFLTAAGYKITHNQDGSLIVSIQPKDFPEFSIRLDRIKETNIQLAIQSRPGSTYLSCVETPGDYIDGQDYELSDFASFLSHLKTWCSRVHQSIRLKKNSPRKESRDRFRAQVDEFLAQNVGTDGDAFFTKEEKGQLFQTLDTLETDLEKLLLEQKAQKEEIERLRRTIAEMKDVADVLPKQKWYKTFLYKIATFAAGAGGKMLAEAVIKGLLVQHGMPEPRGLLENLPGSDSLSV